ncbi:MAG: hypothetical protein KKD94_00965, partial [Nanoarchaeota archaeon]|nr:hypothetical protein [Nanoarchaeota archaeon]
EAGMADRGHNAWGSLLGCYSNVRWNDAGTHVMETTSYNNNLTNVIKREFFVLERMGERWEKKRLTKEEFGNIRIGQIR